MAAVVVSRQSQRGDDNNNEIDIAEWRADSWARQLLAADANQQRSGESLLLLLLLYLVVVRYASSCLQIGDKESELEIWWVRVDQLRGLASHVQN